MKIQTLLSLYEARRNPELNPKVSAYNPVLSLINKVRSAEGEEILYGGNCGMFALAVAEVLKKKNIFVTLGILYRDAEGIEEPKDITDSESDVYHIVIEHNGNYYDGTGIVQKNTLLSIAEDQYGDYNPGFFTEVNPWLSEVHRLIRNDTNWNKPVTFFIEVIEKAKKTPSFTRRG